MEVSLVKLSILFFVCCLLLTSTSARPFGNHWEASDPRCFGQPATKYRLRRSATTNNSGYHWVYNGNSGGCTRSYGKPINDRLAFDSENECNRACRNIYHF